MIRLRLAEVATLTGGLLHPTDAPPGTGGGSSPTGPHVAPEGVLVAGPVVTDSREAKAGSLYVARVGEHADGHGFVSAARDNGAVAALTSRPVPALPCVVVRDVQSAFGRLARGVLDRVPDLRVIAVTGSSGKTSTKDLLAAVLRTEAETVAPVGSLNGEVGVPLTVCRLTASTRFLVVEMGARRVGHIAHLTRIAPPDIGVVLNVGSAHLGQFGSREKIAAAKAELVQALPADGLAVLSADDPVVAGMARLTGARVVTVGLAPGAAIRAVDVRLDALGRPSFTITSEHGAAAVALPLHGAHHVGNALAAAAVALDCGMTLERVGAALTTARAASRWRMEVTERPDGVTLVNDAYNANPESMRAALQALVTMSGRRTWAVLGEMLELGKQSRAEHERLGELAIRLGVDRVVAVGGGARPIATAARAAAGQEGALGGDEQVTWVADADTAYQLLGRELAAGDVVLLKSSRDAGLRWLGDRLVGLEVPSS